jgi:hypothetical protein
MTVFVSSTIYDLLDLRAELKYLFDGLKIHSKFSEINDSKFKIDYKKSSIETCLNNINDVDYFIIIIDQRYGPSLKDVGYEDVSATHLEYKKACELKKKILFCIRDRTEADYNFYKKSKDKENFNGQWVKNQKDNQLFELIQEHIKLYDKSKNNWYFRFENSVQLKNIIKNNLQEELLLERLPERIAFNELPNLIYSFEVEHNSIQWIIKGEVKNQGKTSAFINILKWSGSDENANIHILASNETFSMSFLLTKFTEYTNTLILDYSSYDGINIYDEIDVKLKMLSYTSLSKYSVSKGKKFKKGEPIKIELV